MLFRRSPCALIALLLVVGCSDEKENGGGGKPDDDDSAAEVLEHCSDFAVRLCSSAADCCESTTGPFSPEACASSFVSSFCVPASQVVGEGLATYHPDAEEACLAAWRSAHEACTVDWEEIVSIRRDVWGACKMIRGTTPPGGGCSTASTCEQPDGPATVRCVPDPVVLDTTTCQVLEILGEGAECRYPDGEVSVCDVGLYCTTTERDMLGTCERALPEGGACDSAVPLNPVCGLGNYCSLDDDTCHRATNFGGPSCTLSGECVSFQCQMTSQTCTEAPSTAADLCSRGAP
jgi:hypothetical protein